MEKEVRYEIPRLVRHPEKIERIFTETLEKHSTCPEHTQTAKCIFCKQEYPDGCCSIETETVRYVFPQIAFHYYSYHTIHPSQAFYEFVRLFL